MRTIKKVYKNYIIHPTKIRSQLKKLGYNIGHWWNNGRITGLSNFGGGNIEIKEIILNEKFKTKRLSKHYWKRSYFQDVSVEISIWDTEVLYPKVNKNNLIQDLIKLGYKISNKNDEIILIKGE